MSPGSRILKWIATGCFFALVLTSPLFSNSSEQHSSHIATEYSLLQGDGAKAGVAVEMLRQTPSTRFFRYMVKTPEGHRWHYGLFRDAPLGLESGYFVDEESGWWVRQEIDEGLRAPTPGELGYLKVKTSGEAQRFIVHWSFADGLSLKKTIDLPKGAPETLWPLQAAALRELLGNCESFPPSVMKALQSVKENEGKLMAGLQTLIPVADACSLKKRGRGKELLINWMEVGSGLERIENGLVGRSREILAPFTTIDADRPDATDRLPAGLQLVLGKQIVWPEAEPE